MDLGKTITTLTPKQKRIINIQDVNRYVSTPIQDTKYVDTFLRALRVASAELRGWRIPFLQKKRSDALRVMLLAATIAATTEGQHVYAMRTINSLRSIVRP